MKPGNMKTTSFRWLLLFMCRFGKLRRICALIAAKLEGGIMWSSTLREILQKYYRVEAGMYSYGDPVLPGGLPPGTKVGNYCSLAGGLEIFRRNHPLDRISQHPFFYNSQVGIIEKDSIHKIDDNPLSIGHDVWIGQNVIITPGCRIVGNSAVIASGSVVTSDVPPFSIVAGVPAKVIRSRVEKDIENIITATDWWVKPLQELLPFLPAFLETLSKEQAVAFQRTFSEMVEVKISSENQSQQSKTQN